MKKRSLFFLLIILTTFTILTSIKVNSQINYEITNKQDFINFLQNDNVNMNASYILSADLDFTTGSIYYEGQNITLDKNGLTITPIGEKKNAFGHYVYAFSNPFKGTFNGGGHVIKGLHIRSRASENEYVGLFGYNEGIISNLGLVDSTVDGGVYVGGIAGYNLGTILGCYNTSSITGIGTVGGIAGINYGYIRNSYNTGYVGGATKIGGIVGHNSSVISAVYDLGIISGQLNEDGTKEYGYIYGYNSPQGVIGFVEDNNGSYRFGSSLQKYGIAGAYYCSEYDLGVGFNAGYLKGEERYFDNVKTYSKTLEELKNINNYDSGFREAKSNIYPLGSSYSHRTTGFYIKKSVDKFNYPFPVVGTSEFTTKHHVENSLHSNGYLGSGTIYNPYLIKDEAGLVGISNSLTSAYKLVNNIYLSKEYIPIGSENNSFKGILNGNGKRIANLKIDSSTISDYVGLFAFNSGIIHNLSLDVLISTTHASRVGGVAGFNNGQILEVYVMGSITGQNTVGGIVGANELGKIKNSFNLATVTGQTDIGGIAGYSSGILESVYSATIPSFIDPINGKNLGGIVGYNENTLDFGQVTNALHLADNTIGYQSSINKEYNILDSKLSNISDFGILSKFKGFNISLVSSGQTANSIWAIEPGVNNNLAYLTKTPPIRVTSLELDTSQDLVVDGKSIKVFDEHNRILLGCTPDTPGTIIDLLNFVKINPIDAENKKLSWIILENNSKIGVGKAIDLNGSVLTGLSSGNAKVKVISEDGSKFIEIDILVVERVEEIYLVNKEGGSHTNELDLLPEILNIENFTTLRLFVDLLPFSANNKNVKWISSNEQIVSVDLNGVVNIHYQNLENNPVVGGNFQNEVRVTIIVESIEDSSISDSITLVISPSRKTNLPNDLKVYEKGNILPLVKIGNLYKVLNDQLLNFDTDLLELVFNTSFNQQFRITHNLGTPEDTLVDGKNVYISKGNILGNDYVNRVNIITITIISESLEEETYTLEVLKSLSNKREILNLNASIDQVDYLSYTYKDNTFTITEKIPFGITKLFINPTLVDNSSKYSKSNLHSFSMWFNEEDIIYEDYILLPIASGKNIVNLKVIAEDKTEIVYQIEYEMGYSTNDSLMDLFVGQISQSNYIEFDQNNKNYNITLDYRNLQNLFIEAIPRLDAYNRQSSKIYFNVGSTNDIETNSVNLNLSAGSSLSVVVKVKSESNDNLGLDIFNIYTINITCIENDEADLLELKINDDEISILPEVYYYTYTIDGDISNDIIQRALIDIASSPWSKVELRLLSYVDYYYSDETYYNILINPNAGLYPINIGPAGNYKLMLRVTAQNKIDINEYFIDIIRLPSKNSSFNKLEIKSNSVLLTHSTDPNVLFNYDFNSDQYVINETITVPFETDTITIQGGIYRFADYLIVGEFSNYYSGDIVNYKLKTGSNELTLIVTAEDDTFSSAYVIEIKREYNSNTEYKIEHYIQDFSGTYYLYEIEHLTGMPYTIVHATEKNYKGFTFNDNVTGTSLVGEIKEDGSLVLKLYYSRNSYSLSISSDTTQGLVSGDSGNIKYNYNVLLKATPQIGYSFVGWYNGEQLVSVNPNYSFYMPDYSLSLEARFSLDIYSITYILNGGTNNSNPITYTILDLPLNLLSPSKAGHFFGGWYDNIDFLGTSITVIDSNTAKDLIFYARWIEEEFKSYKVEHYIANLENTYILFETENFSGLNNSYVYANSKTYKGFIYNDKVDGTIVSGIVTSDEGLILRLYYDRNSYNLNLTSENLTMGSVSGMSGLIKYDSNITVVALANQGYKFIGWFNKDNLVSSDSEYTFNMPDSNLDLIAKFEVINYDITYILNDGINNVNNPMSFSISDLPINLYDPTKLGHTFDGWYLNIDYSNRIHSIELNLLTDITLYAKWIINTYEINFYSNGGSEVSNQIINYNELVSKPEVTRLGYELLGWYTDENLNILWDFTYDRVTLNLNLYASWELLEYQIQYELDGGSFVGENNPTSYTVNSLEVILGNANKEGHTFIGWYNTPNFTGEIITRIPEKSTGNISLYARYEIDTFMITINIAGRGSVIPSIGEIQDNTLIFNYGQKIVFNIYPDLNFLLTKFTVNQQEHEVVDEYIIDFINSDFTLDFVFVGVEPNILTLLPNSGYGNKVYSIDRNYDINLFMDYYLGQTVSDIRGCFENSPDRIKFYNISGIELKENQILGTGYIIRLYSDNTLTELIDEVYIVLVGDVNGDGFINAMDINELSRHIQLISTFTSVSQLIAGNPLNTPSINAMAIDAIMRHIQLASLLYK